MKIVEKIIDEIKNQVGDKKVLLGISGGIDSFVLAMLIKKAIGDNLYCVYIDTGLNRPEEKELLKEISKKENLNLKIINAKSEILLNLKNKSNPIEKKEAIKKVFVKYFYLNSRKLRASFIAHGTNKQDSELLIERRYRYIKSVNIRNLEPLINIDKKQILKIAGFLKVPRLLVDKYSISSWGFSRRIIGEVTRRNLEYVTMADDIFLELLRKHNFYKDLKNAAVYIHPVFNFKDKYFLILTAVPKNNNIAIFPNNFLHKVASEIIKKIPNIAKIVYDVNVLSLIDCNWD